MLSRLALRQLLTDSVRAGEWWEYKLVPILATFYATALTLDVPVARLWPAALVLLLSLVPGAAYVSVINDITDREEDAAAGKPNRIAGRPFAVVAALTALPIVAGLVFAWLWRHDTLLLSFYLAAWTAFSLYSLPPFRFRTRGILGVLADACGAHLFPTLVGVVLAYRGAGQPVRPLWIASVGIWAFAYGLRGILWHQLTDRANDATAAVRTFAERHPPAVAERVGTYVAFPVELVAFTAMLWQMQSVVPAVLLAFYIQQSRLRVDRWEMNAVIVRPKPRFLIVLAEYYDALFPIGILVASAARHGIDVAVIAVHLLLFPRRLGQILRDSNKLWKQRR